VPFFLCGGLACAVGRGDEVYPLPDVGPLGVVAIVPEFGVSTADVYGMIGERLTWCRPAANVCVFAAGSEERPRWETMFNDLQNPAIDAWPILGQAIGDLEATGPLRVGLSGSGGTVFGIYENVDAASRAGDAVGTRWRTHVGITLGREDARPAVRNLGG
jgi:4-diphosphocytidyl-2-C-methyl-D-erythritol kinase